MKYLRLITLIFLIYLFGCANQQYPTGGEIDRTPPEITEVYPMDKSVNFNDDHFSFSFSEYIDKRSFQESFFISPKIYGKMDFDWSSTDVDVYFDKDSLKKNTTYTISVGTDIVDLNNKNKMANSYTLSFSTGDSIDYGAINGQVFFQEKENLLIFAYLNKDSINPTKIKPDYITQTGLDGKYSFRGLAFGYYTLLATSDEMRNYIYNIGEDKYGVSSDDIIITKEKPEANNVNFLVSIEDTVKPSVNLITMTDRNHILIEFSEYIDSSKISTNNFYIFDSTSNNKNNIKYVFQNSKAKTYFLCLSDTLAANAENYLITNNIEDYSGNVMNSQETFIALSSAIDTVKPKIIKSITDYEDNKVDYQNGSIKLLFNDGINLEVLKDSIQIDDEKGNSVLYNLAKLDDAILNINITNKLKQKTKYRLKFLTENIFDAANNKIDSLYKISFSTSNDLDFTGVSGLIKTNSNIKKVIRLFNKENTYSQNIQESNKFNFTKVKPGKYLLMMYEDKDSNNIYDYGKAYPYSKSEKFFVYPDTLNLRARWPVGDIEINMN